MFNFETDTKCYIDLKYRTTVSSLGEILVVRLVSHEKSYW